MTKSWIRRKRLFELLLEHHEGITGEMLAKQVGVSPRTIRSDIRAIEELLAPYKTHITSTPNKGYAIVTAEAPIVLTRELFGTAGGVVHGEESCGALIAYLLQCVLLGEAVTEQFLTEKLFVSLTTLKKQLSTARKRFKVHALTIEQYRKEGIRVEGEEQNLRSFLVSYLMAHRDGALYQTLFAETSYEHIDRILHATLSKWQLQLADDSVCRLCCQIAIAIWRSRQACSVNYLASVTKKIESTLEYWIAKDLVQDILTDLGQDIALGEVYYITQCLLTSRRFADTERIGERAHIKKLVFRGLNEIRVQLSIDFMRDTYLLDGLILHLRVALARVQFCEKIQNDMLDTIKKDYPLAFQMGLIFGQVVAREEGIQLSEADLGYVALHFGAAISRNGIEKTAKPKHILIVCSEGLAICVFLRAKIEETFHGRVHIVDAIPTYQLTPEAAARVDYIFSTVTLPDLPPHKVVRISHLLQSADIARIERALFGRPQIDETEVRALFDAENFYVDMEFSTKEACLDFLTDAAIAKGLMTQETKKGVFERERMSSTGIGDLAAIPHSLRTDSPISFISILLLKNPVWWDGLPVMVVFLLNVEQSKFQLWETVFLKLYEYIKKEGGIASLMTNKDFNIFVNEFLLLFNQRS